MFTKQPQLINTNVKDTDDLDTLVSGDDLDSGVRKKYLFSDKDYLKEFIGALEKSI